MANESNRTGYESTKAFVPDISVKITWEDATSIMTSSFIVFTMQSGFALLESGCVSPKNEVHIMMKNAADIIFSGLSYWMFSYGFSIGKSIAENPFIGFDAFFVHAAEEEMGVVYSTYTFRMSFSSIATTIISGAMAERTNFVAYCAFSFFNPLILCAPVYWIWGDNGFLRNFGAVDIAGCCTVHFAGGVCALVATIFLKPRTGRYDKDYIQPPMASPTNVLLGMFMLWWGWLGYNTGSTFGVSGWKWKYAARAAITTFNASVGGGIIAMVYSCITDKMQLDILILVNGILGALVSITAGCAIFEPWESLLIGIIGGLIAIVSMPLFNFLHIDDPVGAIAVHGSSAIWGMLAVGIFIKRDSGLNLSKGQSGLIHGGGFYLLGVQLFAIVSVFIWTVITTFIFLWIVNLFVPIRMSIKEEISGADSYRHNINNNSSAMLLLPEYIPDPGFDPMISEETFESKHAN